MLSPASPSFSSIDLLGHLTGRAFICWVAWMLQDVNPSSTRGCGTGNHGAYLMKRNIFFTNRSFSWFSVYNDLVTLSFFLSFMLIWRGKANVTQLNINGWVNHYYQRPSHCTFRLCLHINHTYVCHELKKKTSFTKLSFRGSSVWKKHWQTACIGGYNFRAHSHNEMLSLPNF